MKLSPFINADRSRFNSLTLIFCQSKLDYKSMTKTSGLLAFVVNLHLGIYSLCFFRKECRKESSRNRVLHQNAQIFVYNVEPHYNKNRAQTHLLYSLFISHSILNITHEAFRSTGIRGRDIRSGSGRL